MENINGISAVIPNYNGLSILPDILQPAITALQTTGLPYEVILSDDFSEDGSVEWVRARFPEIIILTVQANRGFAPTANRGLYAAKYSHSLLLNSDVKLCPDYFNSLYAYFDTPDTFGVMGRIVGWDNDIIQDGGKYPTYHGYKIKTSRNFIPVSPNRDDRLYTFYLSGANAFIDTEKFKRIGGFNESFAPFYVEDFELSLRAWRLGFKCYYDHYAVCRHRTSATIKKYRKKNEVNAIYYRNKMMMHSLHLTGKTYKMWSVQNFAEVFLRSLSGTSYYKAGHSLFKQKEYSLKKYLSDFAQMQKEFNVTLSVRNITDLIKANLKNHRLKYF